MSAPSLNPEAATTGPQVCFDLDGASPGLILPQVDSWPKAYSFMCWFRIEGLLSPKMAAADPAAARNRIATCCPVLLSFSSEDNYGLDLYVRVLITCSFPSIIFHFSSLV